MPVLLVQPLNTTALATIRNVRTTPSHTLTKMRFAKHINYPKAFGEQLLV